MSTATGLDLDAIRKRLESHRHGWPTNVAASISPSDDIAALLAEVERLTARMDLMSRQFRIMQREKEHGWREAEKWEAQAERLRGQVAQEWKPSDGDGRCQECGLLNPCWFAPSPLWNEVMGGGLDDPGGVLCPRCFMLRVDDGKRVFLVALDEQVQS